MLHWTQRRGDMTMWFCLDCIKDIGDSEYCPYCGKHRMGDLAMSEKKALEELRKFNGKRKTPMFSEEECFAYGIHPDDEMYRKTIELNVLSKDYRK